MYVCIKRVYALRRFYIHVYVCILVWSKVPLFLYFFFVIILNSITYIGPEQKNKKKNIKPIKLKAHIQRYTAYCT